VAGSRLPESTANEVKDINQQTVIFLTDFFEQEKKLAHVNNELDAKAMANYVLTLQFGLAVSARNGSDIEALTSIIAIAVDQFSQYVENIQ